MSEKPMEQDEALREKLHEEFWHGQIMHVAGWWRDHPELSPQRYAGPVPISRRLLVACAICGVDLIGVPSDPPVLNFCSKPCADSWLQSERERLAERDRVERIAQDDALVWAPRRKGADDEKGLRRRPTGRGEVPDAAISF